MAEARWRGTLPVGMEAPGGGFWRSVEVRAPDGAAELAFSSAPPGGEALLTLLAACTRAVVDGVRRPVTAAILGTLPPAEADLLALRVHLLFTDHTSVTVACPHCGERLDLQPDLESVEAPPGGSIRTVALRGGTVALGQPSMADLVALEDLPAEARGPALIEACAFAAQGPGSLTADAIGALPAGERKALEEVAVGQIAKLDLEAELNCAECGKPFLYRYPPGAQLRVAMARGRRQLLWEVHALASAYHWGHAEILGLSRALRQEHLEVLEEMQRA